MTRRKVYIIESDDPLNSFKGRLFESLEQTSLEKVVKVSPTTYVCYFARRERDSRLVSFMPKGCVVTNRRNEVQNATWSKVFSITTNIPLGKIIHTLKQKTTIASITQSSTAPESYICRFTRRVARLRLQFLLTNSKVESGTGVTFVGNTVWTRASPNCCWLCVTPNRYTSQLSLYSALTEDTSDSGRSGPICIAQDTGDVDNPFRKIYTAYRCVQNTQHDCSDDTLAMELADDNINAYEILRRDSNDDVVPFRPYMDIEWESNIASVNERGHIAVLQTIINRLDSFYTEQLEKSVSHCFTTKTRTQLLCSSRDITRDDVVIGHKHSYHMIFVDLAFWTMSDCRIFMHAFLGYLCRLSHAGDDDANSLSYVDTAHKRITAASYKFVIDGAVYTKNRLMRLGGQAKHGSNVVLTCVPDCYGITERPFNGYCLIQPSRWRENCGGLPPHVTAIDVSAIRHTYKDAFPRPHPCSRAHEEYAREHIVPTEFYKDINRNHDSGESEDDNSSFHTLCPTRDAEKRDLINTHEDVLNLLSARQLRHDDFNEYYAALVSIVTSNIFTRQRVLEWCNRREEHRAVADYESALNKKREWGRPLSYPSKLLLRQNPNLHDNRQIHEARLNTCQTAWDILWNSSWCSTDKDTLMREIKQCVVHGASGRHSVIGVRGSMGSGKTSAILDTIAAAHLRTVIYVVGRSRLAQEIKERCTNHDDINEVKIYTEGGDFSNHLIYGDSEAVDLICQSGGYSVHGKVLEAIKQSRCGPSTVYVTTINSMCRVPYEAEVDALIIDEAETTISNLYCPTLMGRRGNELTAAFLDVLERAPVVISIDAEHTDPLHDALYAWVARTSRVLPDSAEDMPIRLRLVLEAPLEQPPIFTNIELCGPPPTKLDFATQCANESIVAAILEHVVIRKERVVIAAVHKTRIDTLYNTLMAEYVRVNGRALRIESVTATDKIPINSSINDLAATADVLLFNTALSAGHSIELKNHFSCVFVFFTFDRYGNSTAPLNEQMQMTARVRSCREQKMYYCVEMVNNNIRNHRSVNPARECYHDALRSHFDALAVSERVLGHASKTALLSYIAQCIQRAHPNAKMARRDPTELIDFSIQLEGLNSRMRIFNEDLVTIYTSTGKRKLRRILFRDSIKLSNDHRVRHVRPAVAHLVGSEKAVENLRLSCPVPFELVPLEDTTSASKSSPELVMCPSVSNYDK